MDSKRFLSLAKLWSTTASSPYRAKRIIQRPSPSSFAILSMTASGTEPGPSYHSARAVIIEAMQRVLESWGRIAIVPSSMSSRSASTTAGSCASSHSCSHSGM